MILRPVFFLVPVFAVMYFFRLPREERLMCEAFGVEYRQYMRQTGRLFPRIWNAPPVHVPRGTDDGKLEENEGQ